ncbi:MAG TPA: hypothetical protein DCK87_06990 [Desulfotomaculum sp.]|nr:hypothetical protein [Desulfotomaculum sp.]
MEGAKLNILRINEKISDINEAMATLTDYARQDEQAFLNNPEAIRSARYCFIILTEAATNIATHVCARVLKKAPAAYAESFTLLSEHKIIDSSLAVSLGRMIGFRNLLVHGYNKIDNKKMLQIMRHNLNDVKSYLKAVEELIKKHRGEYQNDKKN